MNKKEQAQLDAALTEAALNAEVAPHKGPIPKPVDFSDGKERTVWRVWVHLGSLSGPIGIEKVHSNGRTMYSIVGAKVDQHSGARYSGPLYATRHDALLVGYIEAKREAAKILAGAWAAVERAKGE